ncbi:MAG: SAM-dependent chlorinase/fluorinase [Actinomycetota bacterium]|nr:SAM-dependent chlorinase/fluorinase [Actinomycetota bacterium]
MALPLTFLSDYGYEDEFAGACRAVVARLAPGVSVVDLTHGIPPGDLRRGALSLEATVIPVGPAVHMAVVDPGVGSGRRAVALAAGESFLVGPDNGLLDLAAARLGGVREAIEISSSALRLEPVAPTFHGRDLFAPVAAHLAAGRPLAVAGEPLDPGELLKLDLPSPRLEDGALLVHVLYADHYGNLILDARPEDLEGAPGAISVSTGGTSFAAAQGRTFADGAGGLVVYHDSSGRLGLALDGGSAARHLGAGRDDELALERA